MLTGMHRAQAAEAIASAKTEIARRGLMLVLSSPSGAGKTTLLEIIAGLRRARKGHIALDDAVLTDVESRKWIPPHLRRIGYVPHIHYGE